MISNYLFTLFFTITLGYNAVLSAQSHTTEKMYFPSNIDNKWETKAMYDLGWNTESVKPLREFLNQKNTKAFIILVNGRIVMEEYFDGHTVDKTWQWNSAGKTLVGATTGIAQQENLLNINDKVSKYIGKNWTAAPLEKENLITILHLITMTTGLNTVQLVRKRRLTYEADAGKQWSYNNVFQKQMDVIASASKQSFESYFNSKLKNKIGMDGYWKNGKIFKIYNSNARSMARFGLLALNNGQWQGEQIINKSFFAESISSSQSINPSYGYFWWLNGKSKYMVPSKQTVFEGHLVPNAPVDMYAAMGAEDNRLYVIPSKNMVVIRMGKVSDKKNKKFAVSGFDNELWAKINMLVR